MALKENYKDDILDTSQNVKRKYQMENNGDGTVSFTDVTEYTQQGDSFGSGAINPIAHAINGLNNYNFHPSGSIDLVAYIADDSYYLNEDNKYVLADSTTGQALINSDPSTYKALASDTDLYGIEGEDTVSGFEPSSTTITVGGITMSTIDEKLNFLCNGGGNDKIVTMMTASGYVCVVELQNNQIPRPSDLYMNTSSGVNNSIESLQYTRIVSVGKGNSWAEVKVYAKLIGKYIIKGLSNNTDTVITANANDVLVTFASTSGHDLPVLGSYGLMVEYLGNN